MNRRDFLRLIGMTSGALFLAGCNGDGLSLNPSSKANSTEEFWIESAMLDLRNILNGHEIPTEYYADQPFLVQTDDGAWLCITTTGASHEGQAGQHVIALRSEDQGLTWSEPVDIEPADGPEASYAVMVKVPETGRIYVFYNHNTDNIRKVIADTDAYPDGFCTRVDSLGYYVFKYSDDNGKTWSEQRYPIPVREFEIDRENAYGGEVRFFWNVGKPFIEEGIAYVPLHKVGGFGKGFFTSNEGVLLKSENILTESDPERIEWETLPDGDIGLRTPDGGGSIAAEQSFSVLSDGSFFVVYRTVAGHPVISYSRDKGHTWDAPQYMTYADGRLVKHPRAANFAWKCENGKFLYWYHNHGGKDFNDRNPAWMLGGIEVDSPDGKRIEWSQPEIALYSDDPKERISYPDLLQEDGKYFLTETQKTIARVHELDPKIPEALWGQFLSPSFTTTRPVLDLKSPQAGVFHALALPAFWDFDADSPCQRAGFTIEMWVRVEAFGVESIVFDNKASDSCGFAVNLTEFSSCFGINLSDGKEHTFWECDRGVIVKNQWHHVAVIVDGGPCVITWLVDGRVCDGGEYRQFGWGRFSPWLKDVNGAGNLTLSSDFPGEISALRVYDRALLVSELIGNYRSEKETYYWEKEK